MMKLHEPLPPVPRRSLISSRFLVCTMHHFGHQPVIGSQPLRWPCKSVWKGVLFGIPDKDSISQSSKSCSLWVIWIYLFKFRLFSEEKYFYLRIFYRDNPEKERTITDDRSSAPSLHSPHSYCSRNKSPPARAIGIYKWG